MSEDWMSRLSDDLNVIEINIPGTHDSHATRDNIRGIGTIEPEIATTQYMGIRDQLSNGVRYVDLRVGHGKRMRHGATLLSGELGDCLNEISTFLQRHPREVVLVVVMWDDGAEADWFTQHVAEQWYTRGWWSGNHWPKLGEAGVRGKAVLLRRFNPTTQNNGIFGIDLLRPSINDTHERTQEPGKWNSNPKGSDCSKSPGDIARIATDHLRFAEETKPQDSGLCITNFAGVQYDPDKDLLHYVSPRTYADALNPMLLNLIRSQPPGRKVHLGVVQLDFMTAELSSAIWSSNFS